jgi:SAM-dependent methyltransferase
MRVLNYTLTLGKRTTPLCKLGRMCRTDKSPLNYDRDVRNGPADPYRHGYTPYYYIKFASLRTKPILFGEVGVLHNASMKMWRAYFPSAWLVGFDFSDEFLARARGDMLLNTTYLKMDIRSEASIESALRRSRGSRLFDVLVEDSTHNLPDQVRFIKVALDHVCSGGTIIIEDIYRNVPDQSYLSQLDRATRGKIHTIEFIDTRHDFENTTGWDNSKLIVITRR